MSGLPDHYSEDPNRVPVLDEDENPVDGPGYVPGSAAEQLAAGSSGAQPVATSSDTAPSVAAAREDQAESGEWSEALEPFGITPWHLPGQGGSGPGCGEWYPDAVCETCGEPRLAPRSCGARSCPDCWGLWAKEAAIRATRRLQAFRYTQPDDWHRQIAHAYVSPPEGEVMNERQYWDGRSKAAEIAKEKGWRGFTVIPHPYRVTDAGKDRFEQADPDYGIWVWLRNDVDDMGRYLKWSPHYHIIGATGADMEPGGGDGEWYYEFRRSTESFDGVRDADSHEDLYGLFRYLLSHTGYPEGSTKQVITWYGDLANSVFVERAEEGWQNQKPSEGVMSALTREIESVAGESLDDDRGDGDGDDSVGECEVVDCDGALIDVFDVRQYLRQSDPPAEVADKMIVALEWRMGEREPPPGLKRPQTEADAAEAFEAMI